MDTKHCKCGGTMHHSSDMDNPFIGTDITRPFWQCEDCGRVFDDIPSLRSILTDLESRLHGDAALLWQGMGRQDREEVGIEIQRGNATMEQAEDTIRTWAAEMPDEYAD